MNSPYVRKAPSAQQTVDLFAGKWASKLPEPFAGVESGANLLFQDPKIAWAKEKLAELGVTLKGSSIVELGPLEGAHTYLLAKEGAASVTAVEAHGDQMYGDKPYVVHLEAARQVLHDVLLVGPVTIAVWLHDVVEDTFRTRQDINVNFGEHVGTLVWAVSGEGANRKERVASLYPKIHSLPQPVAYEATSLKLSDRITNMEKATGNKQSLYDMYLREMDHFIEETGPRIRRRAISSASATGSPRSWYVLGATRPTVRPSSTTTTAGRARTATISWWAPTHSTP